MRAKLLKGEQGTMVLLVYPSSAKEYRRAFNILGGSAPVAGKADTDPAPAGSRPARAAYVVTAATQLHLWDLPDLALFGRPVVDAAGGPGRAPGPGRWGRGPAGVPT